MGRLDDKLAPKIRQTLQRYGVTVTLRTFPSSSSTFAQNDVVDGTPVDTAVLGTPPIDYEGNLINGQSVREGDAYAIISGDTTVVPNTNTKFVFQSRVFQIVSVKQYYGQDTVLAYEVQLRMAA